jgi:uncharacterized protein involved in response to NO
LTAIIRAARVPRYGRAMVTTFAQLTAAPHRSYFAAGGVAVVAGSLGWTAVLLRPEATAVPAQAAHGIAFLLALFGPFVFGFLSTVFARWQEAPPAPRAAYAPAAALFALGALAMPFGAARSSALFAAAWLAILLGWTFAAATLAWMLWRAPQRVVHAELALAGVAAGWVAVALAAAWALGWLATPAAAQALALWGFLLPVYFAVGHRMLPFFSTMAVPGYAVYRPERAPAAWALLCAARLAATLADLPALAPALDAALAAIALRHSFGWWHARVARVRLLAALHYGFAWFGVALALSAIDGALRWAGHDGLGRAPLHALAIGGFGGLLVAMVTRVSLGHSGRALEMDRWAWGCFLGVQAAAVVRVAADLLGPSWDARTAALRGAALLWSVAFLIWTARFAPIWWRPRVDGKPG